MDELADEVFKILVVNKSKMGFLPSSVDEDSAVELADANGPGLSQPEETEETDESEIAARHLDDKLQTNLKGESLQKKLLKLSYEARTTEEEQGVNTLYLAIGFLRWFESSKSDVERQAPLILIPVKLERKSASSRFYLSWDENDISTNLSLREKLKAEFQIDLPEIEDDSGFLPSSYFGKIRKAIAAKKEWDVLPNDMVLWFFSFAKFLMYEDLDTSRWPPERSLAENRLIGGLLGTGFQSDPPICPDDQSIDEILHPVDLIHVVDADSSQTMAIEESKTGRNLVIQGPPGTGKSQTITNIIAAAVNSGKKVLFVAEKMAALQVVHRRLANIGLGPLCLELHSHKANKKSVLQELESTLSLGKPRSDDNHLHANELETCRNQLNQHVGDLHSQLIPSQRTAYQIVGQLVRLHANGTIAPDFAIPEASSWTPEMYRSNLGLIRDLALHLKTIGDPSSHVWRGSQVNALLPADHARIQNQIGELRTRLASLLEANQVISDVFDVRPPRCLVETVDLANVARLGTKAPDSVDRECLVSSVWRSRRDDITELVQACDHVQKNLASLGNKVADVAWETDLAETRRNLKAHGTSWFRFLNSRYRNAKANLKGILNCELPKDLKEQLAIVDSVMSVQKLRRELLEREELGGNSFGSEWKGTDSDVQVLESVIKWHANCDEQNLPSIFFEVAGDPNSKDVIKPALTVVRENIKKLVSESKVLFESLKLDLSEVFGSSVLSNIELAHLNEKLTHWTDASEKLSQWAAFNVRLNKLPAAGMTELAQRVVEGKISHSELPAQFQACYFEQLMRAAMETFPRLAEFDGKSHQQILDRFCELDLERCEFARRQVAAKHFEMLPVRGTQSGEIGIVQREIAKKQRHMPIRKLLSEAGHAVQAIKPVFMMSPISVCSF